MSLIWPEDRMKGKRFRPNPRPPVPDTGWKKINVFPDLSRANCISFDLETKDPDLDDFGPGWGRGVGHIIGVAIGTDDGYKRYYPIRHEECGDCNHNVHDVLDYAREQLGRKTQPKIGHNILYDLGWLSHEGVEVVGDLYDTWIANKLINHGDLANLEAVGQEYLGEGKSSELLYRWCWDYFGHGKPKSEKARRELAMKNLWRSPPELVGFYAESDVWLPQQIAGPQFEKLQMLGLWEVFRMECDLLPLLVKMRMAGVSVDLDAAEIAHGQIEQSAIELQKRVDEMAGKPVNTGSPDDMRPVFDRLKIPYTLTAKSGKISLKGELLKKIQHPLGQMIIDLEELKKYNSTFIEGYILNSNVRGKIHCEINAMRAVTGRMSSSKPNTQNLPSRNDLAKTVRAIFVPDEGHDHWRKFDYSSIESRLLAHFAVGQGSKELREEYQNNPDTDYHTWTQNMIKKLVGLELNRKHVKNVNFAGIYGAGEKKLQRMMELTDEEARYFFDAYHLGLPYIRETMKYMSETTEECGFTRTVMNRMALFDKYEPEYVKGQERKPALKFKDAVRFYGPKIKRAYTHKSLNYVLQGSAADLMKAALVKCWKDGIYDRIGVPRLIVHDEKDFSVAEGWDEEAFTEMKHIMETAIQFKVPVRVEGEWGPNWSELYKLG